MRGRGDQEHRTGLIAGPARLSGSDSPPLPPTAGGEGRPLRRTTGGSARPGPGAAHGGKSPPPLRRAHARGRRPPVPAPPPLFRGYACRQRLHALPTWGRRRHEVRVPGECPAAGARVGRRPLPSSPCSFNRPLLLFSFPLLPSQFSGLLGTVYRRGNLSFTRDGSALISPVGNRISVFDLKK